MDPKAPVKRYTPSEFKGKYTEAPEAEKLAWLDQQPFPGDDTVSLGTVYRRGYNFNGYLHLLHSALQAIKAKVTPSADSKLYKALCAFIVAFSKFVSTFATRCGTTSRPS
jgi:hypothetical protein